MDSNAFNLMSVYALYLKYSALLAALFHAVRGGSIGHTELRLGPQTSHQPPVYLEFWCAQYAPGQRVEN